MKLTTKVLRLFTLIFLIQLMIVGVGAFVVIFKNDGSIPKNILVSLTQVDASILEGVILQNKIGNSLARDLISYKVLELNNVDSVEFVDENRFQQIKGSFSKDCQQVSEIIVCRKANGESFAINFLPLLEDGGIRGYLKLEKSILWTDEVSKKVVLSILMTVTIVFVINALSLLILWTKFLKPETGKLLNAVFNEVVDPDIIILEFKQIQDIYLSAIHKVKRSEAEKVVLQTQVQKINLANQIAHDIRSPLSSLSLLVSTIKMDEERQYLVKSSLQRINEICEDLLSERKAKNFERETLTQALSQVISESKRLFLDKEIEVINDLNVLGAYIPDVEFKSVFSNLLNNAFEATTSSAGEVQIRLKKIEEYIIIEVVDSGVGIPKSVLDRLGLVPITYGKGDAGNGLGYFNAKKWAEKWGGTLIMTSEIGQGSVATLKFPYLE